MKIENDKHQEGGVQVLWEEYATKRGSLGGLPGGRDFRAVILRPSGG